jgi:hypothetical protein
MNSQWVKWPLIAFIAVVSLEAVAQQAVEQVAPPVLAPPPVTVLHPGMTLEEVSAALGPPLQYYDSGHFFDHIPSVSAGGRLWMIHQSRKTESNEFSIWLTYDLDYSGSQAHPVSRVSEIRFKADKPATTANLWRDIPELTALCTPSCEVWSGRDTNSFYLLMPGTDSGAKLSMVDPTTEKELPMDKAGPANEVHIGSMGPIRRVATDTGMRVKK